MLQIRNEERVFPAVTICNLNPYKKSELNKIPELAALVRVIGAFQLVLVFSIIASNLEHF